MLNWVKYCKYCWSACSLAVIVPLLLMLCRTAVSTAESVLITDEILNDVTCDKKALKSLLSETVMYEVKDWFNRLRSLVFCFRYLMIPSLSITMSDEPRDSFS